MPDPDGDVSQMVMSKMLSTHLVIVYHSQLYLPIYSLFKCGALPLLVKTINVHWDNSMTKLLVFATYNLDWASLFASLSKKILSWIITFKLSWIITFKLST